VPLVMVEVAAFGNPFVVDLEITFAKVYSNKTQKCWRNGKVWLATSNSLGATQKL
jgi:hypothetical protein